MARTPEKPQLLDWLLRQNLTGIHSCSSLLDRACRVCLRRDAISAAAYSAANAKIFWNYVLSAMADHETRGLSSSFRIQNSETRTFNCYPVSADESDPNRERALRACCRPSVLQMIDSLNDRQYEALACVLLELLGATKINLTRRGSEGGVDGFGLITRSNSSHLLGSIHHPIRVVLQAKMLTRPMSPDKMKEFVHTLAEVKHGGQQKTEAVVPSWFRASRGAIIGLVVSHNGFQSGAESRARSQGILMADSVDVAEVIALENELFVSSIDAKIHAISQRISELISESDNCPQNQMMPLLQ